jgi:hypothetical protein
MAFSCTILPPATPPDLISHIISSYRYPTTLIIGTSKELFLQSLDLLDAQEQDALDRSRNGSSLLRPTLMQVAVSRHIRTIFIPTVVHLRAYLSVFGQDDSPLLPPPNQCDSSTADAASGRQAPVLLVYGFLELHRETSEWSAQGLASSASALVEAAARNAFSAVIVDPAGGGGHYILEDMMLEKLPVLSGTATKDDGSWSGRVVDIRRALGRWFQTQLPTESE